MMSIFSCLMFSCSGNQKSTELPKALKDYIKAIDYGKMGVKKPEVHYESLRDGLVKVSLAWILEDTLKQDDWRVEISPAFVPDFHWAPHLAPTDDHIIAQHVFRAPALIMSSSTKQLTIIPDLNLLKKGTPGEWYMDINAIDSVMVFGLSKSHVKEHVLYTREVGAVYPPGKLEFGFYILTTNEKDDLVNPWRKALSFFWENWGHVQYQAGDPLETKDLELYVKHTYNWAFNSWRESVWQEFQLKGKKVGAPVFIVNVTRSPNFDGVPKDREFKSIWNQAWFSSLRSASGLFRYAKRIGDLQLLDYARMTKELALSFPQKDGFFYSVVAPETSAAIDTNACDLSKEWSKLYFGNSNRNPYTGNAKESPFHILDMSTTAYQMLMWHDELEKDQRLLDYATAYADALIDVQDSAGFFPGWLSIDSLKPLQHLNQSPETSMSVTFLLKQYELTSERKYLASALKAMDAVIENIIPVGRWEDFETYWSCSRYGSLDLVGEKVKRNNMYKQNNFSIYWTADALFNCYRLTKDEKYLMLGQRTLDELLMSQATWQPPYMHVNTLGGFGVMNADAEWNDSRQSLFAGLIVKYGKELNNKEYIERGIAALRASFVMMYCPENLRTKAQWERKWSFFGKEDYGFMMENYGHDGTTSPEGVGIGEFTIYDWGNGAASEAYNRMVDEYGESFVRNN